MTEKENFTVLGNPCKVIKTILRDTGEGGRSKNYELLDLVDIEI